MNNYGMPHSGILCIIKKNEVDLCVLSQRAVHVMCSSEFLKCTTVCMVSHLKRSYIHKAKGRLRICIGRGLDIQITLEQHGGLAC